MEDFYTKAESFPAASIKRFCKKSSGFERVTTQRIELVRKLIIDVLNKWINKLVIIVVHSKRITVKPEDIIHLFETLELEFQRKGFDPNTQWLKRCSSTSKSVDLPCGFFPKTVVHDLVRSLGVHHAKEMGASKLLWSAVSMEFLHYNLERYIATKITRK